MLTESPATGLLAVFVALLPAILRLWWGGPLARAVDDPALPERLAANRRRNVQATAACCAVLIAGLPSWAFWTLPLLMVARLLAAYPLRKRLYGETWSVFAYLSFYARLIVALFGCWILLALLPYLSLRGGSRGRMIAVLLAALLVIWHARSAHVLRWLMRARPLQDSVLLARFNAMVGACGIPAPRFEYVDLGGGAIANALAVPALRGAGVIFTDTLLARLETNEIVAICAHELAHLEYYDRLRMRRMNAGTFVLIAAGAALAALAQVASRGAAWFVCGAFWPFAMMMILVLRARHRQRNETASDIRAVTLCGDAEALAGALTRLYEFARIPRRWDLERERQATHPSLARRLRDIRAAAGTAAPGLDSPAQFAAAYGSAAVTFERGHLVWQEGDAVTHRFTYAHLTELRLEARTSGAMRLVAVEANGRRWEMPLASVDVERAQQILNAVDGELSQPVNVPSVTPVAARLFTAMAAIVGLAAGQFAFALVTLLAASRCAAPTLFAAGAAAMAAALLVLRDANGLTAPWIAAALVFVGAGLIALGRLKRDDASPPAVTRALVLLGILAAMSFAGFLSQGIDPVRLHQTARANWAAAVMLVALSGALASFRLRLARYAALLLAIPALFAAAAGSSWFVERFSKDPFLVTARPLPFKLLNGSPLSELAVTFDVGELRVSPHGGSIAVSRSEDEDASEKVSTFHIGPATGPLSTVAADEVAFLDDTRAAIMTSGDSGSDVRVVRVDNPATDTWHVHVEGVRNGTLSVDAPRERWQILGWDSARRIVRASGKLGSESVDVTRWNGFAPNGAWVNAITSSGTTLVAVDKRYDRGIFGAALLRLWPYMPLVPIHNESRIWRVTPEVHSDISRSLLDADCTANVLENQLVCTAYDGVRTGILRIDAATAAVMPMGSVAGRFIAYGSRSPGWLTGWVGSTPAAIHVTTGDAIRVTALPRPASIAAGVDVIATTAAADGGSVVRIYRY